MDGTGELFAPLEHALGQAVTVHRMRYPVDEPLDYAQLERWLRPRLPQEPFVLLGESFSGPLAIAIAADPPPPLRGVVLCCTFARSPSALLTAWHAPAAPAMAWLAKRAWASGLLGSALFGAYATRSLQQRFDQALRPVAPQVLAQRMRAVARIDVMDRLRTIRLPMLALTAREDRLVRRSAAQAMARARPGLQILDLPGPHGLLQAAPERCAQAILQFCRSLTSAVAA